MSGDLLRRAATKAREVAEDATAGTWWAGGVWWDTSVDGEGRKVHKPMPTVGHGGTGADLIACTFRNDQADADHIALWHPDVALAVADWLDVAAAESDCAEGDPLAFLNFLGDDACAALAVARLLLGEES